MRKDEIRKFARELGKLEERFGVVIHSDNYHTPAIINDKKGRFSYHYKRGEIVIDNNTFIGGEDY